MSFLGNTSDLTGKELYRNQSKGAEGEGISELRVTSGVCLILWLSEASYPLLNLL